MSRKENHLALLHRVLKPDGEPIAVVGAQQRDTIALLGYSEEWEWCQEMHRSEAEAIEAFLDVVGGPLNAVCCQDPV